MNNIQELLDKQYDNKRVILDAITYYENKLMDNIDLKYIYTTWISDTKQKLYECEIEIQYLQREVQPANADVPKGE